MEITHQDKQYKLNVEKAIADGYLLPVEPKIEAGNAYKSDSGVTIILIKSKDYGPNNKVFSLLGKGLEKGDNGFCLWRDKDIKEENFRNTYPVEYWRYFGKAEIVIDCK